MPIIVVGPEISKEKNPQTNQTIRDKRTSEQNMTGLSKKTTESNEGQESL